MVNQGLTIMATGMLVVFAFLTTMVFAMKLMSGIILKFFPEKKIAVKITPASAVQNNELELAIAIAAAYMRGK